MPLKIIRDRSAPFPQPQIRTVYVPDRADAPRTRPQGSIGRDKDGRLRCLSEHRQRTEFFVGLDLGQAGDYTAVAIIQKMESGLHVRHLDRVRGVPYPRLVETVTELMGRPELRGKARLIVDATGAGRPVLDMLRDTDLRPVAVTIHGGAKVAGSRYAPRVPKRDLINGLLIMLQNGVLKIASNLPHAPTLTRELSEMRRKVSTAGHDSYGV